MNRKLKLTILFSIALFSNIYAQRFVYDVDFLTYFDNRESRIPYYQPQTIFGIRLSPELGVAFSDSTYGSHRLLAGISYIQPFGSEWRDAKLHPTVYYKFNNWGFTASLGFIPWRTAIHQLPEYLFSDSISFYSPNINGAMFAYQSKHGFAQFICDWRGMQSKKTREAFRLILSGQYQYKWFITGGNAQMNHLANKAKTEPRLGVCDDITIQPFIGFDLSYLTPLDTLALRTSYVFSFQRSRISNNSTYSHGFLAELSLKWRFIGLHNILYVGQPIMTLYSKYGADLNQGCPNYQYPLYNHTELSLYILQFPFADLYFSWNFHYVQKRPLAHQQLLTAHFNLDKLMNTLKHKHNKKNRKSSEKS